MLSYKNLDYLAFRISKTINDYCNICICTMMKPYFKGKTASTKPMYSRNLIHPRVYENTPQLHSKVQCLWWGKHSPMSGLWHHSTSQLYYGFLNVYGLYPLCSIMEFLGLRPWNTIIPHSGYNTHTP